MKRRRGDKGEKGVESDFEMRWRAVFSPQARNLQSALTNRQRGGGKFLVVNAACHSEGAGVSSWESGDEGRINWHSGGER